MNQAKILVVEDEESVRQMIVFNLSRAGFDVDEAADSATARVKIADNPPDLVLIDWMLPDSSGLELTRSIRREDATKELAIIMLTARAEEQSKVAGLNSGADDYVTKPFSQSELLARINAVLRRGASVSAETIEMGLLKLHPEEHRLFIAGQEISLGPTEFNLLRFFMQNPERVYSREQILDRVWGQNIYIEERTVDVHVQRLRKELKDSGADRYIQTVRGAGYRFSVN